MKRSCLRFGVLALVTAATAASPARAQTRPAGAAPLTPEQLFAHVMHGVVALERNGVPVAVGTVLSGDGRILTALSALAGGEGADVLYADGTVVHAKVGRSDRAVDLALLVPQSLKWTEGLGASGSSPAGEDLRAMLPAPTAGDASGAPKVRLAPAPAIVKGDADAHARDGSGSLLWLDVDTRGAAPVAGAPLLDAAGDVAAILVRACKGPVPPANDDAPGAWSQPSPPSASARAACKPIVVGAPVSAIRAFLSGAPVVSAAAAPGPWLGIRGEREEATVRGVRVVAVAPASPAEKASLKPAVDVIVAVDGHPIDSPEKLADVIAKHAPGDTVKLLVFGADQFREVPVALRPATPSPASRESPAGGASTERGAPGALPPLP